MRTQGRIIFFIILTRHVMMICSVVKANAGPAAQRKNTEMLSDFELACYFIINAGQRLPGYLQYSCHHKLTAPGSQVFMGPRQWELHVGTWVGVDWVLNMASTHTSCRVWRACV